MQSTFYLALGIKSFGNGYEPGTFSNDQGSFQKRKSPVEEECHCLLRCVTFGLLPPTARETPSFPGSSRCACWDLGDLKKAPFDATKICRLLYNELAFSLYNKRQIFQFSLCFWLSVNNLASFKVPKWSLKTLLRPFHVQTAVTNMTKQRVL